MRHIRTSLRLALYLPLLATALTGQSTPIDASLPREILKMSEAGQAAYVRSYLDEGMPVEQGGALTILVLNRSALVLPMLEKKIEEVMNSPTPAGCFTRTGVDAKTFVDMAAETIAYASDGQALKEIAKLMKIDQRRFGRLVVPVLAGAIVLGNPFTVAYRGLDLGDPNISQRIMPWVEFEVGDRTEDTPRDMRHRWAEAMLEKYGAPPTEAEWVADPIASRLKPSLAQSLHNEMMTLAVEALEARTKK